MANDLPAGGWVAVNRSLLSSWIWSSEERYNRPQAWVELIMMAAYKDDKILYRGQLIQKKRGQIRASIKWLADRWNWDRKTVKNFLDQLQKAGSIVVESDPGGTTITLVNYDFYQPGDGQPFPHQNGQQDGQPNGQPDGVDHGQPKNSPYALPSLDSMLSIGGVNGQPKNGKNGPNGHNDGQPPGQPNGQQDGQRINNINNIKNLNKQEEEGPAARLAELRRRRDEAGRR